MGLDPLKIIKEIGILSLWDGDGSCPCGRFYITGINIHIHCWRTSSNCDCKYSGIHISQHYDFNYSNDYLLEIGKCIKNQLEHWDTEFEIKIVDFDGLIVKKY